MSNGEIIGERIKYYRKLRGLTQVELAQELGVAPRYIGNVERGIRGASVDMLVQICKYFKVNMSDLLPVELSEEPSAKEKIIDEIVSACWSMELGQIGIAKKMVYALND